MVVGEWVRGFVIVHRVLAACGRVDVTAYGRGEMGKREGCKVSIPFGTAFARGRFLRLRFGKGSAMIHDHGRANHGRSALWPQILQAALAPAGSPPRRRHRSR